MSDILSMSLVNWPSFAKGLVEAQKLKVKFMRQEMKRGSQRIKKTFIREQLQGPPGIKAGPLAKGKNIWTFVTGETSDTISGKIGISRILHVHEVGLTIKPKKGNRLFIRASVGNVATRQMTKEVVAVVPQVKIPARLKFRQLVAKEAPKELAKVAEAGSRGVQVALTNALKKSI